MRSRSGFQGRRAAGRAKRYASGVVRARATSIIWLKLVWRSSAGSPSPVSGFGDREQAQRLLARACGVHVERGCLHLNGEYAHLLPRERGIGGLFVEGVAREHVAHANVHALRASGGNRALQQVKACDGSEVAGEVELVRVPRVGACALGGHHVAAAGRRRSRRRSPHG